MNLDALAWQTRTEPLAPEAVVGLGDAALWLAHRALSRTDEQLARLRGAGGTSTLVLLGEAADLPWAPGVCYLARDPRAPAIYLPTTLEPDAPLEIIAQAFVRRFGARALAFAPNLPALVPLDAARPLERARLVAWLEKQHAAAS